MSVSGRHGSSSCAGCRKTKLNQAVAALSLQVYLSVLLCFYLLEIASLGSSVLCFSLRAFSVFYSLVVGIGQVTG